MGDFSLKMEQDDKIIEEMISKVDKGLIEKIFLAAASKRYTRGVFQDVKLYDGIVDTYLKNWAKQKYHFYILMGKRLKVESAFAEGVSTADFQKKIRVVYDEFPIYAPLIREFSKDDIMTNRCPDKKVLIESCEGYKVGQKLSKFLSHYLSDVKFDIALSKVMQYKSKTSILGLSIDPADYLCMSVNNHGWNSCYKIGEFYGAAPFSCMEDHNTLMSYQKSDEKFTYKIGTSEFEYFSFKQRSAVMIEENLQFTVLSTQPSGSNSTILVPIENIIKELFNGYFGKKVEMSSSDNQRYEVVAQRHHMQHDLSNSVWIQEGEKNNIFKMGQPDLPCLVTGKPTDRNLYYYPLAV